MGYNALPVLPNADPVVGGRGELSLEAAAQLSGPALGHASATPYFRLTLPFREVAAIEIDGTPVEVWRTSPATQARLSARRRSGIAQGDLRFGGRFLLLDEGRLPALGLRFSVKSTTGAAFDSRRFTNSTGYEVDALAGKDVGRVGRARLRALGRVGLGVWQFADDGQDDAVSYGVTLRATMPRGAAFALEWRGYAGWRGRDSPSLVSVSASAPRGSGSVFAMANVGVSRDAPPLELRVGISWTFDMPRAMQPRRPDPPRTPPSRQPLPPFAENETAVAKAEAASHR
jgi:hypothetical protein